MATASFGALLLLLAVLPSPAFAQANNSNTSDLSAGGLKPPPPGSGPPGQSVSSEPSDTQKQLEQADQRDSGRGLEFVYFNIESGLQMVGLRTLSAKDPLVPETVRSSDTGAMFGVGAGLRLLFLTVGPRFRLGHFSDWDLWSLDLEAGMHIPLGNIEPYFTLGGGYSKLGQVSEAGLAIVGSDSGVSIRGFNVRGGVGLDYYLTNIFSVGANLSGEVLAMTRPKVSLTQPPATTCQSPSATSDQAQTCAASATYAADGSSVGMSATLSAVLGVHF